MCRERPIASPTANTTWSRAEPRRASSVPDQSRSLRFPRELEAPRPLGTVAWFAALPDLRSPADRDCLGGRDTDGRLDHPAQCISPGRDCLLVERPSRAGFEFWRARLRWAG